MNIIEDLHDKNLLGVSFPNISSWRAWEVYLGALFGLGIKGEPKRAMVNRSD